MAIVVELQQSRSWSLGADPVIENVYEVSGTADDQAAYQAVLAFTPSEYQGLLRSELDLDPVAVDTSSGTGRWTATIRYKRRLPKEVGDSTYQFEIGGGTQRITHSLETVGRYSRPGVVAADFKGAIGVTGKEVRGVDVPTPKYGWSETHYRPDSVITGPYKALLNQLEATVNDRRYKDFERGENLFIGASGGKRGEEDWEVTYRFSSSPNRTGIVIGEVVGIEKRGWDYLWVRYEDEEDDVAGKVVKRAEAVYVERVLHWGNHAQIGIGS